VDLSSLICRCEMDALLDGGFDNHIAAQLEALNKGDLALARGLQRIIQQEEFPLPVPGGIDWIMPGIAPLVRGVSYEEVIRSLGRQLWEQ
jgi:hypothetical protein